VGYDGYYIYGGEGILRRPAWHGESSSKRSTRPGSGDLDVVDKPYGHLRDKCVRRDRAVLTEEHETMGSAINYRQRGKRIGARVVIQRE